MGSNDCRMLPPIWLVNWSGRLDVLTLRSLLLKLVNLAPQGQFQKHLHPLANLARRIRLAKYVWFPVASNV
jgi:hypothetical protein